MENLKFLNKFYLDKEKDIIINLYQPENDEMTYILETPNHGTGNLIKYKNNKSVRWTTPCGCG